MPPVHNPNRTLHRLAPVVFIGIILFCCSYAAFAQTTTAPATTQTATAPSALPPPEVALGLWTLLPALVAIVLAIITRSVIPALAAGVFVAAIMGLPWTHPVPPGQFAYNPLTAMAVAVHDHVVAAVTDTSHVKVLMFTLIIAGMVGILAASGGTAAMVNLVAPWARDRRRCQVVGWLAGLVVFFDDYANTMIVGPTMRPITDRMKVSREKLSYIVDSTAAPVASIALIGTWLGAEIGFLQAGFDTWTAETRPAFLTGIDGFGAFYCSIPYRYYPIFALVLVFLIGITGRDFGAMLKAERREAAKSTDSVAESAVGAFGSARGWWTAALPIAALVVTTLAVLFATGRGGLADHYDSILIWLKDLLAGADPYGSIMYGAIAGLGLAVLLTLGTRKLWLRDTMKAMLNGMARVFRALIVLVLAWALSSATQELHLAQVATSVLQQADVRPHFLPLAIFVASCVVAFATGTSWGTMGILCPVVVVVAGNLFADLPRAEALPLFYAAVGSVLAGAVFGDHCSPISDTTVLSALASECTLEAHVWTQMPYALLAAACEIVFGDLLCSFTGLPFWVGLALGTVVLILFVRLFGKHTAPCA
jgi:Na+/H+ antiporter NhaC